jgi:hypothetical protein
MAKKMNNPFAVALGRQGGRKGGPARAAIMTPEQRSESARNAVVSRWARVKESGLDRNPEGEAPRSARFQELYGEWKKQRGGRSSITQVSMMPAYQSIIGMGADAVPLILRQLRLEGDQPDQWFWALRAIAGANPVGPQDQGDFPKMAQAWIKWGEDHAG